MGIFPYVRRRRAIEKIVRQYNEIMEEALGYDGDEHWNFCVATYRGFLDFLLLAPDERAFAASPFEHREQVLNSVTDRIENAARQEDMGLVGPGTVAGMRAAQLHCAALCWQETELAAKIAEELAPFVADGKINLEA